LSFFCLDSNSFAVACNDGATFSFPDIIPLSLKSFASSLFSIPCFNLSFFCFDSNDFAVACNDAATFSVDEMIPLSLKSCASSRFSIPCFNLSFFCCCSNLFAAACNVSLTPGFGNIPFFCNSSLSFFDAKFCFNLSLFCFCFKSFATDCNESAIFLSCVKIPRSANSLLSDLCLNPFVNLSFLCC